MTIRSRQDNSFSPSATTRAPFLRRSSRVRARVSAALVVSLGLTLGLAGIANALADPVPEGEARNFAILAGSTITNANQTTVTGDIGLHPGDAITGYGPGANEIIHTGEIFLTDAVALDAKNSLTTAYNNSAAQAFDSTLVPDLTGANLTAGVYNSDSGAFELNGTMTLTGDADSIFIFQMTTSLTTASGSSIVLDGAVDPCNVYWQVGSEATLGTGSSFTGTVMADQSISVASAASVEGRLWARIGAVTLDNNTIANPCFVARAQIDEPPAGGVATGDGTTLALESGAASPAFAASLAAAAIAIAIASGYVWRRRTTI